MGNRAVVTVKGSSVGVYLHWNGGAESVRAFLRAAQTLEVRDPTDDPSYFYARFAQIVGNFFGGTTSVGIESLAKLDLDNGDNGVFVIGKNFAIVGRQHQPSGADRRTAKELRDYEAMVYAATMAANREAFAEPDYRARNTGGRPCVRTLVVQYIPEDAEAPATRTEPLAALDATG